MRDCLRFLSQTFTLVDAANQQLQNCGRGTNANELLQHLKNKALHYSHHVAFDPLKINNITDNEISRIPAGWIDTRHYKSTELRAATLHYFAFLPLRENDYQTIAWVVSIVTNKSNTEVFAIEAEKRYSGLMFKQRQLPFLAHLFLSTMEANKGLSSYLIDTKASKEYVLKILNSGGDEYEQTNHKSNDQGEKFSYRQKIKTENQTLLDYFGYREPLMLFLYFNQEGIYLRGSFE